MVRRGGLLFRLDESLTKNNLRGCCLGGRGWNRRICVVGGVQFFCRLQFVFEAGSRSFLTTDRLLQIDDEVGVLVVFRVLRDGYPYVPNGILDRELLDLCRIAGKNVTERIGICLDAIGQNVVLPLLDLELRGRRRNGGTSDRSGELDDVFPVSYTHLTLPTKRIV